MKSKTIKHDHKKIEAKWPSYAKASEGKQKVVFYNHRVIEKKWQKKWEKSGIYKALDKSKKPKFYSLIEFPYPSGDGLHVGHIRSNTAMDIISRKRRMEGYNVLYPIGWDAFGLPTENYAIKTGIHPIKITKKNTDIFRRQLKSCGFSFDWDREIDTTDPNYYKWTQWIFLQLLKRGLAYKKKMPINWCLSCKIGLANEEVIDNHCERCGGPTDRREKEQWMLAITKYAGKLDKDLDIVNYLPNIKLQQRNWIGKSEGATIKFKIKGDSFGQEERKIENEIEIFTTRADTIFGATYLVLAPDHQILTQLKDRISNGKEVEGYVTKTKKKTEIERTAENKEKTGIELSGVKAINPANQKEIPIFIADYVLSQYGTGAIMAVPAHDERDLEFAKKFNLPIVSEPLINKEEIVKKLGGQMVTKYKLRDWIFSRQRYWGEPIPVINCEDCGHVPVPEKDLPVKLPNVKNYKPTDTGESPLAAIEKWVKVKCPKCNNWARRETDTMPNWAGSSWYYLAYCLGKKNLKNKIKNNGLKEFWTLLKRWLPVDWYNGGMEHVTLHLLYSRFWHKFLYDQKFIPTGEPYQKRTAHGFVLAEDGQKMSKSRGNVINPDSIVKLLGADTLRVYEMFMGPFAEAISWNVDSVAGSRRFIERVWRIFDKISKDQNEDDERLLRLVNQTVKKVSEDYEEMKFNTAVAAMMILVNEFEKASTVSQKHFETFLILLAPLAPHITEELWERLGNRKSIHLASWPKHKLDHNENFKIKIVIQINSKTRDTVEVRNNILDEELKTIILQRENVKKWMEGRPVKNIFIVKNRLVNIVI